MQRPRTWISQRRPHSRRVAGVLVGMLSAYGWIGVACERPSDSLELVGTLERTQLELTAPASERISRIEVERGDRVHAGEVIVRLDPTYALADLAGAEASVAAARTAATIHNQDRSRAERLAMRGAISEQARDRARLVSDQAQAELWASDARLAAARRRVADLTIVSPAAGVIDQLPFDVGERVPVEAVVAVVLAATPPWVRVWIPERLYSRVRPGLAARIWVDGIEGSLVGRVLDVNDEPEYTPHYALTERERVRLVYQTRIGLEASQLSLRPGAPARVELDLASAATPPS